MFVFFFSHRFHREGVVSRQQNVQDISLRPMHCQGTDTAAISLKLKFSGFSESSFSRDRQFCASCPFGSPASVALFCPTDLQCCAIRYLQDVFKMIDDDLADEILPDCFKNHELSIGPNPNCLLELDKDSIHFFDGDGGEVRQYLSH